MTSDQFHGTWNVELTSGTPFGIGSSVLIEPSAQGENQVLITFDSLSNRNVEAVFDPETKALQAVTGLETPARAIFISRYVDGAYSAIYGLTINEDRQLAVWGAAIPHPVNNPEPSASDMEVSDRRLAASSFDGQYTVRSTSGTQFGIGSKLVFSQNGLRIAIKDAFDQEVPAPDPLTFDTSTDSLSGTVADTDPIRRHQWSLATHDGYKYVYGLSTLAVPDDDADVWPEQAGACGAEEEPGPDSRGQGPNM